MSEVHALKRLGCYLSVYGIYLNLFFTLSKNSSETEAFCPKLEPESDEPQQMSDSIDNIQSPDTIVNTCTSNVSSFKNNLVFFSFHN